VYISSSASPSSSLPFSLRALFSFLFPSYTLSTPTTIEQTDLAKRDERRKKESSRALICICLGGMAAEFVIFGAISPRGSDNDLRQVLEEIPKTSSASSTSFRLSSPLLKSLVALINNEDTHPHPHNTPLWIDDDTLQIISEEFQTAVKILEDHRETVALVAELLAQRLNQVVQISEVSHLFPQRPSQSPVPSPSPIPQSDAVAHTVRETIQIN
jgi:ATP-dependent Zn protease